MELPKKINRLEAKVSKRIAERVRAAYHGKNWALEIKVGNNKVKEHQAAALGQVEDGKFLYKLVDSGIKLPFDFVCLGDADAIVCRLQKNGRDVHCVVNGHYEFKVRI